MRRPASGGFARRVCDRCGDRRIAIATGWPVLPDPVPPEVVIGADGREHRIAYRLLRTPGGIAALAEEQGAPPGGGYELSVLGPHDASADQLAEDWVCPSDHAREKLGYVPDRDWRLAVREHLRDLEEHGYPWPRLAQF